MVWTSIVMPNLGLGLCAPAGGAKKSSFYVFVRF